MYNTINRMCKVMLQKGCVFQQDGKQEITTKSRSTHTTVHRQSMLYQY